jgi:hypothetical protein
MKYILTFHDLQTLCFDLQNCDADATLKSPIIIFRNFTRQYESENFPDFKL